MNKKATKEWKLAVSCHLDNLAHISEFVTAAANEAGLDEQATFAVQLATDEACCNIMEHACEGSPESEIKIRCCQAGDDFVVTLEDDAPPFDPIQVSPPDLEGDLTDRHIGGLGLHFMRCAMDEVHFASDSGTGNKLTMIKHGVARKTEEAEKLLDGHLERAEHKTEKAQERLEKAAHKIETAQEGIAPKAETVRRRGKVKRSSLS